MSADLQERADRACAKLSDAWAISDSGLGWWDAAETGGEPECYRRYEIDKILAPDEGRAWIALEQFETIYENGRAAGRRLGREELATEHMRVLGLDRIICDEIRNAAGGNR